MGLMGEQWEFLKDVAKLIEKANELGYLLTAGEAWRPESQAFLNSQPSGSTLLVLLPDSTKREFGAKIGGSGILKSKHGDRLAIDFNIFKQNDMTRLCTKDDSQPLGDFWQSLNPKNRWGGYFTSRIDSPHFERNLG